jgi:hypothetical protein
MMKLRDAENKREQLGATNSGGRRQAADRTTALLISIVAVFLITELPQACHRERVGESNKLYRVLLLS